MRLALALCLALGAGPAMAQTITGARYGDPTDRYPHGVLGDEIEYAALTVTLSDGTVQSARWNAPMVFEDIAPRLADVDGDGAPEIIVVESHERQGARLAVWGLRDGVLTQVAQTPFIGTRFRWLAPVGAADLDGDGRIEIAYVDRPHLAKTLRVWRFENGGLTHVADAPALANHRIGEDFITGGVRTCGDGPDLITADAAWRRIMATRFDGKRLVSRSLGAFTGPAGIAAVLACR